MPIGRRVREDAPATPVPVSAPAAAPVEVDKYADKPYVSENIARAMAGEKVQFGTDVFEDAAPAETLPDFD